MLINHFSQTSTSSSQPHRNNNATIMQVHVFAFPNKGGATFINMSTPYFLISLHHSQLTFAIFLLQEDWNSMPAPHRLQFSCPWDCLLYPLTVLKSEFYIAVCVVTLAFEHKLGTFWPHSDETLPKFASIYLCVIAAIQWSYWFIWWEWFE